MKKLTLLLIILGIIGIASAQAPQSINYQAIAWNNDNTPKANLLITVKISILNQTISGPEVFSEDHQPRTNSQGLFILEIGSKETAKFQSIDWGNGPKFLKVAIDGITLGTTPILSVPYALYAEKTNLKAKDGISLSGNTLTNTGDLDNTNEIQTLSLNGSQLSLSKNGGTVLLPTSSGSGTTYSAGSGISISPTNVISTDLKAGEGISINGNVVSSIANNSNALDIAIFEERKPQGQTLPAPSGDKTWNKRILSDIVLSSNSVTLVGSNIKFIVPGTYMITASAPAYRVQIHRLCLRNAATGSIQIPGSSEFTNASSSEPVQTRSFLTGLLVVKEVNELYYLDHYVQSNSAGTNSFGLATNDGTTTWETYAQVTIQKIN